MELKGNSAELCCVLFGNTRIRSTVAAARCVEPLLSLLVSEFSPSHHTVVGALDKLLDDDQLADLVAAHDAVVPIVSLLFGKNYDLHETIARTLVKLGRDRPGCKLEMVNSGVIESLLYSLPTLHLSTSSDKLTGKSESKTPVDSQQLKDNTLVGETIFQADPITAVKARIVDCLSGEDMHSIKNINSTTSDLGENNFPISNTTVDNNQAAVFFQSQMGTILGSIPQVATEVQEATKIRLLNSNFRIRYNLLDDLSSKIGMPQS